MSNKDRTKICKIISNMLNNPNEHGIYPTDTAYSQLEMYMIQERVQVLGWMYAEACNALDRGEEIRTMEIPDILARMHKDLDQLNEQRIEMKELKTYFRGRNSDTHDALSDYEEGHRLSE